jgi:hypothetical protein
MDRNRQSENALDRGKVAPYRWHSRCDSSYHLDASGYQHLVARQVLAFEPSS